ncbi:hypothetical protein ACMHYJ_14270 [Castellaniella hirudinis]|uniref:hypothetical protein n=1 Tax=Castellaniella hirudinis TaxID=1144617 RepID=UPI0039C0FE94
MDEQFPRQTWRLLPSYRLKEVTLVAVTNDYYGTHYKTAEATYISAADVWPTREEAIAAGHRCLDEQQKALEKRADVINKRRAELDKAAKQRT